MTTSKQSQSKLPVCTTRVGGLNEMKVLQIYLNFEIARTEKYELVDML